MPDIFVAKKDKSKAGSGKKKPASAKSKKKKRFIKHKAEGRSHNPLTAFSYFPEKANFVNQDPEEEVILILRRHPATNIRWILIVLLMISAPLILTTLPLLNFLPIRFQIIALISWYLLTLAYAFEQFLSWFFNVNIITDERIIDVDFINLVYREMTDANIDQIQDVTVRLGSVIRTMFNYGDVIIQTAAEIPQIEFQAIPKPDEVARILREERIEEEKEKLEGRVR